MVQLSLINFFKRTVPGHIFRGKTRLVRKVTYADMQIQIGLFQLQERNMTLLRKPYLTLAESSGHSKALGKKAARIKFWYDNPIKLAFRSPNIKIEDRLKHLRVNEAWE